MKIITKIFLAIVVAILLLPSDSCVYRILYVDVRAILTVARKILWSFLSN